MCSFVAGMARCGIPATKRTHPDDADPADCRINERYTQWCWGSAGRADTGCEGHTNTEVNSNRVPSNSPRSESFNEGIRKAAPNERQRHERRPFQRRSQFPRQKSPPQCSIAAAGHISGPKAMSTSTPATGQWQRPIRDRLALTAASPPRILDHQIHRPASSASSVPTATMLCESCATDEAIAPALQSKVADQRRRWPFPAGP